MLAPEFFSQSHPTIRNSAEISLRNPQKIPFLEYQSAEGGGVTAHIAIHQFFACAHVCIGLYLCEPFPTKS
jgi:hypothetical protein